MQNYYLIVQIAHILSQLVEKLNSFRKGMEQVGRTVKSIIEDAVAAAKKQIISLKEIHQHYLNTKQLRY